MHVAVGAPVRLLFAPVAVEGFAHRTFFFAPEISVDDIDRIIEQGLCTGTLRDHRRTGGQRDESVQVGVLAGIAVAMFGSREPAAMQRVAQRPAQGANPVIHQFGKAR
ncbi:hypothetical protein D3C86_1896130 [compost metagenome]